MTAIKNDNNKALTTETNGHNNYIHNNNSKINGNSNKHHNDTLINHTTTTTIYDPTTIPSHLMILSAKNTLLYVIIGGIVVLCLLNTIYDIYTYGLHNTHIYYKDNIQLILTTIVYYSIHVIAAHITTIKQQNNKPNRLYVHLGFILGLFSVLLIYSYIPLRYATYRYIIMSSYVLSELHWLELIRNKELHHYNGWYRSMYLITFCPLNKTKLLCDQNALKRYDTIKQQRQYYLNIFNKNMVNGLIWLHLYALLAFMCIYSITIVPTLFNIPDDQNIELAIKLLIRAFLGCITIYCLIEAIYYSYCIMYSHIGIQAHHVNNHLLQSTSLGSIWSTRWNQYIQPILYNNIYKVLQHNIIYNKYISSLLTFIFSGVWLHVIPAVYSGMLLQHALYILYWFMLQCILISIEHTLFDKHSYTKYSLLHRIRTQLLIVSTIWLALEPFYDLYGI